jgi:hypothetical protein
MRSKLTAIVCFLMLISACSVPTPVPTPSPSATETLAPSPTIEVGTQLPFTLSTPAIVIENPAPGATPSVTPTQVSLRPEKVTILRPADGSMVVSPLRVVGQAGPAYLNRVEINLIGEDGRLIAEHHDYLYALPGNLGPYNTVFEFETPHLAEAARLEVRNYDPVNGQLDHLSSVDLTLLSVGNPRIHYTIHGPEKLQINSPYANEIIEGNSVIVSGVGWPDTEEPLHVEIINSAGEVIGSGLFKFKPHEIGVAAGFEIELNYRVDSFQLARIAVYEMSNTIPGMLHYSSIPVRLRPE